MEVCRQAFESRDNWEECERFWQRLFSEITALPGVTSKWRPWFRRPFVYESGEGLRFPEDCVGHPIFDAVSDELSRTVRILLHREDDGVEIDAWLGQERDFKELPAEHLTISCFPSEKSAQIARELLTAWVNERVSYVAMQDLIDALLDDV